jgi:cellulose biosynthesis protein BcsQ
MKTISVFNNKGGVGKTTLLCNLASYISKKRGKRVLVVDADPQCNASIYLFGIDKVTKVLEEQEPKTVNRIFDSVQEGKGFISKDAIPIEKSEGFDVDVIFGDTNLSTLEDFLSSDWLAGKNGDERGLRTTLVFCDLLRKLQADYDYVFFDIGPSLGAINRVVLFACNFFLMPVSSDIFCLKAIDNISEVLKKWTTQLKKGLEDYEQSRRKIFQIGDYSYENNLNYLGYVVQQYRAKLHHPVKAYEHIITQIPERIKTNLQKFYPSDWDVNTFKIGDIPNFNSLIPLSQIATKPVFSLEGKDGVVGAHFAKVKEFENVIKGIVLNIFKIIEKYDTLA